MRRAKFRKRALAITGALLVVGVGTAYAEGNFTTLGNKTVGKQADGSYLTITNQFVTPVGDVIKDNGRPFGLTLSPDGKTAASLNTGGGSSGIVTVFDLVNNKVLQHFGGDPGPSLADRPGGGISDGGIIYSPDGKYLWAAQQTKLARFDVAADGTLSNEVRVPLPGANGRRAVPAGLAWAPNGTDLLVTLSANNTLAVLDTATNTVVKQIPVGNVPNSVVVIDGKAYVSNQGGRPAQPGGLLGQVSAVTASAENPPNETAANLKDGDPSTKWLAFNPTGWVTYQLAKPAAVVRYSLTSANDSPGRDPKDFTVQGSNDGSTWTDLDRRTGQSFSGRLATNTYSFTNTTAYSYYRLNITANSGDPLVQLADWNIFDASSAPADKTDNSYGTPIVTNNNMAVPSTGTVSEVDLASGRQVNTFTVGLQPSALLAVGKNLIVANTDDDSVTTIDTAKQQLGRTFVANPAPGAPFGAQPNGLTMLDPTHLAVSLGRYNTVAVYGYHDAYAQPTFEGLIPAGSYPSGIALNPKTNKLVVASENGLGSVGANGTVDEGNGTTPVTSHYGLNFVGTVQQVSAPSVSQMETYTQQVFKNNQWNGLKQRNQLGNGKANPVAVPLRVGDPSTIQHVFFIVKENRTYDQILGDVAKGNGDPSLAQFGQQVTPNTHSLATTFPLIDNLYSDGTNSGEGHHWITQAFLNNYMQQMYGNYSRSYQTGDPMSNVKSGAIWDNALNHGKTVTNWGEQIDDYLDVNGNGSNVSWSQWYHDSQVLEGKASGPLNTPIGTYHATSDIPSLLQVTHPNFPTFDMSIPDQYRADLFQRDFANYVTNNNLPALNMMWLPGDHTEGTNPGRISTAAHVADNDLALGRIVDTISHSPYWKNTAIFVLEDDSQNGVDHLDGHRNPTLVISPYATRGAVVHNYYSQLNAIRTIEQILGLPPMNSQDLAATPMYDAFTNKPNYTPYTYLPNQIPLNATNPQPAQTTSAVQSAWAQWSAKQNFRRQDMVNMAQENRDIWYSSNNFTTPYPGDSKVLLPNEVPGATVAPTDTGGH